jgi:hypothetical protein
MPMLTHISSKTRKQIVKTARGVRPPLAPHLRSALKALVAGLPLQSAMAHHSGAEYEYPQLIEIEGTLVDFAWQNPHVHFSVRSGTDASGQQVTWDIEANSLSVLRRTNSTREKLRVGDKVRVAGNPSKRAPNRMFATNLLRADGTELVLGPGIGPHRQGSQAGSLFTLQAHQGLPCCVAGPTGAYN